MDRKAQDVAEGFVAGRVGRRELVKRLGALGLTAAAADVLVNAAATKAFAADFNWKAHQGKSIKALLNKHPYADAMIADLESFKQLTGMNITYDIFPEDVYFDKVTAALSSRSTEYDVFMTGAYQTWQYGPAGWLVDLNEYLNDPAKTAPKYDWNGILPNLRSSTAWSGKVGDELGGKGAKQWALPWGWEMYNLSYNETMLKKLGVKVPTNMPELMEASAKVSKDAGGAYGVGVRGSRSWATIHPGYLSGYTNFGAKDFTVENGKLKSAVNSAEAKKFTADFVKMVQDGGPQNWATYTWYQVGTDLGAGASAMIYDADILGYFMNGKDTKEHGHIAYAPLTPNPDAKGPTSNVWIWSLGMSNFSKNKDAAWTFMQWASGTDHLLFGARKADQVNPVRSAVWQDPDVQQRIKSNYPGYIEEYDSAVGEAKIYFTPQPLFFNVTTDWAASLQKMVAKQVSVDEGLDQLADSTNRTLKQAGIG